MRRLATEKRRACSRTFSTFASFVLATVLAVSSPAQSAVDYDAILRDRLNSVRELLDRRQASRSMLTAKIERFSARLDQLQAEREAALEALTDQQDRARALEKALDRLVPRVLPRLNHLDQLRKEGARTIAGLATMERTADLEERTRSRLMATQTVSIEQMRQASTALRLLRRMPNAMTARHRDVNFQIPLLSASAARLDLQQSQLQRRRDAAVRDLAELTVEIDRLTTQEHRLARNMIARSLEATDGAGADTEDVRTTLPNRRLMGKATLAGADIRGIALRRAQPTPVARPLDLASIHSRIARAASIPSAGKVLSAKSEATALVPGRADQTESGLDVGTLEARASADSAFARVPTGRLGARPRDDGPVLMPTIEAVGYTAAKDKRSNTLRIELSARPRQLVAAPDDGRIAFAGDFRSYGLLLIIEHGNGYHTLLWGFSSLDIALGDAVRAGQIIGVMDDGPSPKLCVELRRNGQPVSPEVWLAASNSGVKG